TLEMNDILGNECIEKTMTFNVDFEPPEASTVIKNPYFTNDVISNEKPGSKLIVDLEEQITFTGGIIDVLNPTSGSTGDGFLGSWPDWAMFPQGPGTYEFDISLAYTPVPWFSGILPNLPESVYTLQLGASTDELSYADSVDVGPLFVKNSPAVIQVEPVADTINASSVEVSGTIIDKFIEWQPRVKEIYGLDYDVNDYLFVPYELTNHEENT